MEDSKLIAEILDGSEEAFEILFDKYYSEGLRVAYLIVGNKCDSEYVVQDTFINCHTKLKSLKNPDRFRYWFFRILTRNAYKYCGKRKREQPLEQVYDNQMAADDKSAFQILAEQETANEIRAAIEKLNPKQKTAVVLYYYRDFSVAEIAEIMHCTQGTVKSRLFNARKNLGKELHSLNERSFDND